jgi:hypothetical protein
VVSVVYENGEYEYACDDCGKVAALPLGDGVEGFESLYGADVVEQTWEDPEADAEDG